MNNYHLSLKEPLLIFKLKQSLNVAKESIPLYLFDNDSEHCYYFLIEVNRCYLISKLINL